MYFSMFCNGRQGIAFSKAVCRAHDFAFTGRNAVASLEEKARVEQLDALLHELKAMLLVLNALYGRGLQSLSEQF
jgi:hypothetical protein